MTATLESVQLAKGSTLRSTLAFVEAQFGAAVAGQVLARLEPADRDRIRAAAATDELPWPLLLALWRAADDELGPDDPRWAERSGAFSIESMGVQMYRGILLKSSPLEFLTQGVSLFQLYYQPGDMQVVEEEPGRAILRLVGFDPGDTLFCRRQTGGLLRSIELAGGVQASVRHVRCAVEGDAFCEWELRWK
ncbi:MAG TPA: hypothetical protein VFE05_00045 [Longimicrobiaceae bacterium]|jgi:hypothetical protein|nr:hypothetical protein [Longimicrobiaceae bacterium]